jgi:putative restriction endonuclease
VYLAGLGEALGQLLLTLIEEHADPAVRVHLLLLAEEGEYTASLLDDMQSLREVPSSTERDALTKARLGQGLFRGHSCRSAMKFTGYMAQQMRLGLIWAGGSVAGRAGRGWAGW